jgi:hypothetical protein
MSKGKHPAGKQIHPATRTFQVTPWLRCSFLQPQAVHQVMDARMCVAFGAACENSLRHPASAVTDHRHCHAWVARPTPPIRQSPTAVQLPASAPLLTSLAPVLLQAIRIAVNDELAKLEQVRVACTT